MHVAFIPYGIKQAVDHLFMDMQAQKFQLRIYKEGEKDKYIWMQGQLRILPFGICEYVFPKEMKDLVLTSLDCDKIHGSISQKMKMGISTIRKMLNLKEIPEFKKDKSLIWIKEFVSIIPVGMKEDGDIIESEGPNIGWSHEAI